MDDLQLAGTPVEAVDDVGYPTRFEPGDDLFELVLIRVGRQDDLVAGRVASSRR